MTGLVSYGIYIPTYRIKLEEIAKVWKKDGREVIRSLFVKEKSVPAADEDAVTLALEAASAALTLSGTNPEAIDILLVGSESHPYAVNPTSTIVGELLGVGRNYLAGDVEFACKAGTAAIQVIAGMIASGHARNGLAVGTDTAQSKPHDVLEYTSAAGSAAFLMGSTEIIAELSAFTSFSSDTPDFWRRDGIRYPSHAGRFTGLPAYYTHVTGAAEQLLHKHRLTAEDINYCVFHMPNGKFPRDVARRLGFSPQQLEQSLVVDEIGNPYSASAMLGLAAVMDIARPGASILMVSYGSGAGSDAFLWQTTKHLTEYQRKKRRQNNLVRQQVKRKYYIDYTEYLKQTHKI